MHGMSLIIEIEQHIPKLIEIAREAASIIMEIYQSDFTAERKSDDSPVTKADKLANDYIVEQLAKLTPHIPIVSEEGAKPVVGGDGEAFWLVDPLDGTRSFIARDGQFTINIGLVQHGRPQFGLMQLPARGDYYWGIVGKGAWRRLGDGSETTSIHTREPALDGYDVVMSKVYKSPKTDGWLQSFPVKRRVQAGSALKFVRVAEGAADIYPRLGNTMEWDTAAGHAILEAAGGSLVALDGSQFRYGKQGYLNGGFVASGRALTLPTSAQ